MDIGFYVAHNTGITYRCLLGLREILTVAQMTVISLPSWSRHPKKYDDEDAQKVPLRQGIRYLEPEAGVCSATFCLRTLEICMLRLRKTSD